LISPKIGEGIVILTVILNYQIFRLIESAPEFVPGLENEQSRKIVASVLLAEISLLILGIILAILQIFELIWKNQEDLKSRKTI
jgi:hypothetical protein